MQLDHLFTDEQKALREMLQKFVAKEIMPIRARIRQQPIVSFLSSTHSKRPSAWFR
jgi:hypothetical protein